jgi:hypothetical protein
MEQWQRRRAEENQRRNHQHQENVLDHMDGERNVIERRERRA